MHDLCRYTLLQECMWSFYKNISSDALNSDVDTKQLCQAGKDSIPPSVFASMVCRSIELVNILLLSAHLPRDTKEIAYSFL